MLVQSTSNSAFCNQTFGMLQKTSTPLPSTLTKTTTPTTKDWQKAVSHKKGHQVLIPAACYYLLALQQYSSWNLIRKRDWLVAQGNYDTFSTAQT